MAIHVPQTTPTHEAFMHGYAFDDLLRREVDALVSDMGRLVPPLVTEDEIEPLPAPVRRYMHVSGVVGKPRTLFARWRFTGHFRRSANQKWMPLVAEQYNRIDRPARLWYAMMNFMPLVRFYVRDAYNNGEGHMYAKATPWITVFDTHSPELTQGELVILLNDMLFFPSALLSDTVRWDAINDYSARATLLLPGLPVSAVFTFDDAGDVIDFIADRYAEHNGQYTLTPWSTPVSGHRTIDGVRIPTQGEATWLRETGPLTYARLTLDHIETNVFARYP